MTSIFFAWYFLLSFRAQAVGASQPVQLIQSGSWVLIRDPLELNKLQREFIELSRMPKADLLIKLREYQNNPKGQVRPGDEEAYVTRVYRAHLRNVNILVLNRLLFPKLMKDKRDFVRNSWSTPWKWHKGRPSLCTAKGEVRTPTFYDDPVEEFARCSGLVPKSR